MRTVTFSSASQPWLSLRPWGIVLAPSSFGSFSNDLLIGNFGNGEILAYDATTDMFLGTLDGANGQPLVNDHLWALETRAPSAVSTERPISQPASTMKRTASSQRSPPTHPNPQPSSEPHSDLPHSHYRESDVDFQAVPFEKTFKKRFA